MESEEISMTHFELHSAINLQEYVSQTATASAVSVAFR